MYSHFFRRLPFAAIAVASLATLQAADVPLSRQHADAFSKKIDAIASPVGGRAGIRKTPVTETEVNSWMAYRAQPLLPQGVAEPSVSIIGNGRIAGRAIVDLDAVSKQKSSGSALNPWRYIGGRVPVIVNGTLQTKDGVGRFELESAQVSTVPIPKFLLQELLSHYSRTPNHPQGISLDAPFQLPANIRQIEVGQGQAVVVQ